tara:strand:+ start:307 stop:1854 length:1548 start_codon:yes stop_codon:yes gene_type:complete
MKYYLEKATIKNIVTILTLILFSVILFYRYTIINGIDNLQLFQIYLRTLNQNLYQDYGFLFGPGTNFLFLIFSKLNIFNFSTIQMLSIISLLSTLLTSHIICKIYSLSSKNYNWFLFFISAITFYGSIGGYYNDHFSYTLSLLAVYLFLKNKENNFLVLFIVGVIFSTCFFFKTSFGLVLTISFILSYLITNKEINFLKKDLLIFYFGGLFLFLAVNFYFFIQSNDNFFINTYIDSFKLQIQGGQKPIIDFFYALIFPFKINPFQLIKDLINSEGGLFRLIFYPNVLIYYFGLFYLIKNIKKLSFPITYIVISTWLVVSIAGKGSSYFLLCTSLLLFLLLDYINKNLYSVKLLFLIYFVSLIFLEVSDINPNIQKINGKSGTFYLSQKNTTFNLTEIDKLNQYINDNIDKEYAYTSDDLNFIPFLYDKPPSQYQIDIGQMRDYNQKQFLRNYWQSFFNFTEKKNTEIFFVLTSNSSIRDNKNYENFNKYLLPYFQKNNFEVVKKINDLSIFQLKN